MSRQEAIIVSRLPASACSNFTVVVPGKPDPWLLRVSVRSDETVSRLAGPEPQTATLELELSELDLRVLRAYAAPLLKSGVGIATHKEVAQELHCGLNTPRNRMYLVLSGSWAACTPMVTGSP